MEGLGFKLHPEDAHLAEERLKACLRTFVQREKRNFEILRMFNILFDSGAVVRLSQKMALKEAIRKKWSIFTPERGGNDFEEYIMPESYKMQLLFEPHKEKIFDKFHNEIPTAKLAKMQRLFARYLSQKKDKVERIIFTYLRQNMNYEVQVSHGVIVNSLQKRMLQQIDFADEEEIQQINQRRHKDAVILGEDSETVNESSKNGKTSEKQKSEPLDIIGKTKKIIAEANARGEVTHHYPFQGQKKGSDLQIKTGLLGSLEPAEPVTSKISSEVLKIRTIKKKKVIIKQEPQQKTLDSGVLNEESDKKNDESESTRKESSESSEPEEVERDQQPTKIDQILDHDSKSAISEENLVEDKVDEEEISPSQTQENASVKDETPKIEENPEEQQKNDELQEEQENLDSYQENVNISQENVSENKVEDDQIIEEENISQPKETQENNSENGEQGKSIKSETINQKESDDHVEEEGEVSQENIEVSQENVEVPQENVEVPQEDVSNQNQETHKNQEDQENKEDQDVQEDTPNQENASNQDESPKKSRRIA